MYLNIWIEFLSLLNCPPAEGLYNLCLLQANAVFQCLLILLQVRNLLAVLKHQKREKSTKMKNRVLKEIPMKEVQLHDTYNDIWIILFNRVFDITSFLHEHPGGYEVLLEYAGRDASLAFLGAGHDSVPMSSLKNYLVGILPESEHLNLPFPDWNNRIKEFQS